ncbi:hypothetical protein F4680DRAFT_401752 [Xylaria scruposa]|nr:hypothetical protein F4680DRAFT_401752 [Xylaria scruposa]
MYVSVCALLTLLSKQLMAPECPLALPRREPAAVRKVSTIASLRSTPAMADIPSVLPNTPGLDRRITHGNTATTRRPLRITLT